MQHLLFALLLLSPAGEEDARASAPSPSAELPAEPTDARGLLAAMATVEGLEARFTERKSLALLKAPLVSAGVIYYTRPGHLARIIETPSESTVRIGPKSLEVSDASGKQQFDLRSRPDIKMFVESFVHVVAGNYEALASTYELGFKPAPETGGEWALTLTPLRQPLSTLVTSLEIRGHGYSVLTILVREAKGDSTEITMSSVDPHRAFSDDERSKFFGLPAAGGK